MVHEAFLILEVQTILEALIVLDLELREQEKLILEAKILRFLKSILNFKSQLILQIKTQVWTLSFVIIQKRNAKLILILSQVLPDPIKKVVMNVTSIFDLNQVKVKSVIRVP